MSKRTVIVLAALNAALLAFILIYERDTFTTSELAGRSRQVLRTFLRDRVDRVELVRGDEPPLVLVRHRGEGEEEDDEDAISLGTWAVEAPIATAADEDAVDGFLSALEWLSAERTLEEVSAEDRRRFGLDAPRFVVRYQVGSRTFELRVGGEAPTGDGVYVAVEGEGGAYVVGDDFVESIDHDLTHFRSKEIFGEFYPTGAERVQVDDVLFVREGDLWRLRAPARGWASQGLVDRLLRVTRELRAVRFVSEEAGDLGAWGLDAPWHTLTVTRGEDVEEHRTARLSVGGPCGEHDGERYAMVGGEGPVVCVQASDLEALELDPDRLREPRLVPLGQDEIAGVVLSRGGSRLELSREGDGWQLFTGPEDARGEPQAADEGAVGAWLTALRDSRALAYAPLEEGAHGTGAPRARLVVRRREGAGGPIEIALGEGDEEGVWVRRGDERAIVRFAAAAGELLDVGPLRFRVRDLFEAEGSDADRIEVTRGGRAEVAVRGEGGVWRLEAPVDVEADRIVVRDVARQLATLRAERFVAEAPRPEHGLERPRAVVRGHFAPEEGEASEVTLRVGAATAEGSYGQLEGQEAVFLLSAERVDALLRSLASLDLLTVDPEGLESLRIERGEERLLLRREGTAWRREDGSAPDPAGLRSLLDRLGTLRAVAVDGYREELGAVALRVVATRRPTAAGERTVTLEVGPTQGEGDEAFVLARRVGVPVVLRLRPDSLRSLSSLLP